MRLLQLFLLLALVQACLKVAGYARTRRWCEQLGDAPQCRIATAADIADARRLAELTDIAGRHGLVRATCLRQALVVTTLLRRRGFDAQLRIGVQRDGEPFAAHAWVALNDVAVGPNGATFAAFGRDA